MISVVIPTVAGREEHLERCLTAYAENTVGEGVELLVQRDHATCGLAWNAGVAEARGEFLHLTADDLEPRPGWNVPAQETVERGKLPAPVVLRRRLIEGYPVDVPETSGGHWGRSLADREITLGTCVVPFCLLRDWRANVGPSLETHYFTDNWFTDQCRRAGLEFVVRQGYAFVHHWATAGRGAGMGESERIEHDRVTYQERTRELIGPGGGGAE